MKRMLLSMFERLGYVLVHADVWRSVQDRAPSVPQGQDDAASGPRALRAQTQIQALERRCAALKAELTACQDRLAQADASGRIRALEQENRELTQRLADIEVYLKETRGKTGPSYL